MMFLVKKNLLLKSSGQNALRWARVFPLLLLCCLVVLPNVSQAGREGIKHGAVMARTLVLDSEGRPILVEYDAQGNEGEIVSEKLSPEQKANMDQLVIMSIAEYKMEKLRYDNFIKSRANDLALDAELMSREEYEQTDFTAADGKTTITKPTLKSYAKGVLVRGQSNRIVPSGHSGPWEPLVLLSFGIDLSQSTQLTIEQGTLLVDAKGQIIHQTENNIAPRVGFFGDPDEKQEFYSGIRDNDDQIFGPIKDVKVFIEPNVFLGSLTTTDSRGKYTMRFLMPYCPGGMEFTTDLWAELKYANFSPFGSPALPYHLRRQDWTYCYEPFPFIGGGIGGAMAYANALATSATLAMPMYNADFKVDVMFLSGKVFLKNPDGKNIPVGDTTEYALDPPTTGKTATWYDFDGDGKQDKAQIGTIKPKPQPDGTIKNVFEQDSNGEYQAVWFSSQFKPDGSPNVIRLADVKKNLKPNGLLKSISAADLKNTDILVFRESTGQLVLERQGLRDEEIAGRVDHGLGKDDKYFYYRLMMRGPMDLNLNVGVISRNSSWDEWATEYKMGESFRKREADHLKSGEWIRIVVINRATGYMGTQRVLLGDASTNKNNMLNVKLDDIYLMPPNLKIWAERNYRHEYGLDKGKEEHNSVIGTEGASTTDDQRITVFTEWYDEEGRPLPEGLGTADGGQYGLTARLARVTAENKIEKASDAGHMAEFAIRPGSHMEVLREKDNMTKADHFYIHVIGTQKNEKPNFENLGSQEVLDTRPKNATPFLVPFNDENADWKNWSAWNQLKRAYDAEQLAEEPIKPRANYSWQYRPEYQFSQVSLEVESIIRSYTNEAGKTNEQELLFEQEGEGKVPTIRGNDDLVTVFYSLIANNYNRLSPLEGEQEFVFGLGASEIKATVGSNGEIRFDNLAHIDSLDPTDLLSIRLYLNHDAANTLWEWAFTRNGLHVYFSIPGNTETRDNKVENDIEILSLLETLETGQSTGEIGSQTEKPSVRTLGGIRLRYRYVPPALTGLEIKKVKWVFNKKGAFCLDYGIGTDHCPNAYEREAGQEYIQEGNWLDWSVYWEPRNADGKPDWTNWAGTKTDDSGIAASLEAEYTVPVFNPYGGSPIMSTRTYKADFFIKTRMLKVESDVSKLMQGSDVAMLEAMLWQLGVSPQKGSKGKSGARINSDRGTYKGTVLGLTQNCDGSDPKVRNLYSGGWDGCSSGKVSMEGMVRRFQGRNIKNDSSESVNGGGGQDGIVGNNTLRQLDRAWSQYISAYHDNKSTPEILNSAVTDKWLEEAVMIWDSGFGSLADATYTDTRHNQMLQAAGLVAGSKKREDLLRKWKTQETSSHWGEGSPKTNYRMTEGNGDEYGSLSFNQVLFQYRYSDDPCKGHKDSALNFYKPVENIKGFSLHTALKPTSTGNCPGSFYFAYVANTLGKAHGIGAPLKYRHDTTGSWTSLQSSDDEYEILAKAIAGYNGGPGFFANGSWAMLLSNTRKPTEDEKKIKAVNQWSGQCFSCEYTISVRNVKYGLPYRQYLWKGGVEPDEIPVIGADGSPETNEDGSTKMQSNPKAGQDWCFAYGEQEWMSSKIWEDVKNDAESADAIGNYKTPIGRVNCQ